MALYYLSYPLAFVLLSERSFFFIFVTAVYLVAQYARKEMKKMDAVI